MLLVAAELPHVLVVVLEPGIEYPPVVVQAGEPIRVSIQIVVGDEPFLIDDGGFQRFGDLQGGDVRGAANNPVFQALQIARNEAESEVEALRAIVDQRQRKVAELRGLIDEMPEVEAELAALRAGGAPAAAPPPEPHRQPY